MCSQSIAVISFLLDARPPVEAAQHEGKSTLQVLASVDWVGSVFSLGMIVPLLLALQWGGNQYPWDDKAVIICLYVVRIFLSKSISLSQFMSRSL